MSCRFFLLISFFALSSYSLFAQRKLSDGKELISPLTREYVYPVRVVWSEGDVQHVDRLLQQGNGQANLTNEGMVRMRNTAGKTSSLLLDFGKELHGAVEFVTGMWAGGNVPRNIRVRFGESVSEAMSTLAEHGATNDHAIRDFTMQLPWLGKNQTGESGFRFVRIDLLDAEAELQLREVRTIFTYRDIPYLGSFNSSDERLNEIWEVGAYTVHLNMQEYLWDGIKRDRLVWVGDLHPEVATINAVFGFNEVVPKSLDLARDATPLPGWMCGISTYSMWWIVLQHDWYMHHGDRDYLNEQHSYLRALVNQIVGKVKHGKEAMDGNRFLDWPSSEDSIAVHAGLQAMTIYSLEKAALLSAVLGDKETQKRCEQTVKEMRNYVPAHHDSKQVAALFAETNIMDPDAAYELLAKGGAKHFSTFYGYYMLQAMAKAGRYEEAMEIIRVYWGGMLDLGATSFWEDFNIDWLPNAGRIDELPSTGKVDVHATFGDYCYIGHRHSFCHGWASGPTAWLAEHVLGIKVMEAGSKVYRVKPNLGNLSFAEGSYPTPYGVIYVKHSKDKNGKTKSEIKAPAEVRIIRD